MSDQLRRELIRAVEKMERDASKAHPRLIARQRQVSRQQRAKRILKLSLVTLIGLQIFGRIRR